jgi:pyruvyl transferase EpsO
MDISSPDKIRDILHKNLGEIGKFEQCALLDYPDNRNPGDQAIWLGNILYLTDVLKVKINYASSPADFSEAEMEKRIGKAPILLHGGGNLGDIWSYHQKFRERIIANYSDRPIFILPQSIYFESLENAQKVADIFNSHPNLTIFARDNYSYDLANRYFGNCRILKSPDIAFQMANMPNLPFTPQPKFPVLYLCRSDKELNQDYASQFIDIPDIVVNDWKAFKGKVLLEDRISYKYEGSPKNWSLRNRWNLTRELFQRNDSQKAANSTEIISCYLAQTLHPYASKITTLYNPYMHRRSWGLVHSGIYQLKQYRLVITNRLHGHILCTLLNIPHIFLPNSYHKNEEFYKTWTYQVPFCRFIKDASKIKNAVLDLLEM